MRKYVLHPGYVTSQNDGDRHWIDAATLARLYGVSFAECVVARERKFGYAIEKGPEGSIHLFPDYSGRYKLQGRSE